MIYQSLSQDPFINLALEQQLFEAGTSNALFLYQNNSSVIIGRAQNPWVECDVHFLKTQNIPLARRQSGGGTVFHDLGNLNFTFFCEKANYNKEQNLALIIKALATLNINVDMNTRHDLILNDKKISGSAFRETKTHAFHHGTLLIDSNLDLLRQSLKAPEYDIKSKGVASVKSSVINIKDVYAHANIPEIIKAISNAFEPEPQIKKLTINNLNPEILALYQSDTWRFERTLPFSETIDHVDGSISELQVESGIITEIKSDNNELLQWLQQPYAHFYHKRALCKQA
jgi:lipoate-protein ligase A